MTCASSGANVAGQAICRVSKAYQKAPRSSVLSCNIPSYLEPQYFPSPYFRAINLAKCGYSPYSQAGTFSRKLEKTAYQVRQFFRLEP